MGSPGQGEKLNYQGTCQPPTLTLLPTRMLIDNNVSDQEKALRKKFDSYVKAWDWPGCLAILVSDSGKQLSIEAFIQTIFESPNITFKRGEDGSPEKLEARNAFMRDFAEQVEIGRSNLVLAQVVRRKMLGITLLERGFQILSDHLSRMTADGSRTSERIWEYIDYSARQAKQMYDLVAPKSAEEPRDLQSSTIESIDGQQIHVDAVLNAAIEAASKAILMECYHDPAVLDSNKAVCLEERPANISEGSGIGQQNFVSAFLWSKLEEADTLLRYTDAEVQNIDHTEMPEPIREQLRDLPVPKLYQLRVSPDYQFWQVLEEISKERITGRMIQLISELMTDARFESIRESIKEDAPIPPLGYMEEEELVAAMTIRRFVVGDDSDLSELYGGLSLAEWIRGFTVLKTIVAEMSNHMTGDASVEGLLAQKSLKCILESLNCAGLSSDAASKFVNNACFGRAKSADLYDRPLLAMNNGNAVIYGPGVLTANLARVILSISATYSPQSDSRGGRFEKQVIEMFKTNNIFCEPLHFYDDEGSEFEFDAIVVWDNFVFNFECKSRSAVVDSPVARKYFRMESQKQATQVNRQLRGLANNLAKAETKLNVKLDGKTLVGCVVSLFPYSIPKGIEGVFFADFSSLQRFFKSRYIYKHTSSGLPGSTETKKLAVDDLWGGVSPSPDGLLRQLELPSQVRMQLMQYNLVDTMFPLGNDTILIQKELKRIGYIHPEPPELLTADYLRSLSGEFETKIAYFKGEVAAT